MKTTMTNIILIIASVMTALSAGLFFAWACSVVPGLGKLSDANYLSAMQSINREILNPIFFSCFMGAVIMLPVATFISYSSPVTMRFWLLLAAAIVYIVGVFGVTVAGNVPLNNILDATNLQTATLEELAQLRASFENTWNNLNTARAFAGVVSLVLVSAACLSGKEL